MVTHVLPSIRNQQDYLNEQETLQTQMKCGHDVAISKPYKEKNK